jgi:hypothetical protein
MLASFIQCRQLTIVEKWICQVVGLRCGKLVDMCAPACDIPGSAETSHVMSPCEEAFPAGKADMMFLFLH